MQQRALQLVVLGCLVALAGCTGALSGGDGGAGDPTLDDVTYPPGVSQNGTNVSALGDAHAEALNGSSFTLGLELTQNGSTGNQSLAMRAAVGADHDRVSANVSGVGREMATYLTEEKRYVRVTSDGETTYRAVERTPDATKLVPSSYSGATYLGQYAGSAHANFTPTGVRVVNGTTLVVLESDGSNVSAPDANVSHYEATMLVDERGVVHRFEVTVRSERDGESLDVSMVMTVSDVNETTVTEPSWLDEAKNQTSN